MKNFNFYESPDMAEISVVTEKGFADSLGDRSFSLDGYGIQDVEQW